MLALVLKRLASPCRSNLMSFFLKEAYMFQLISIDFQSVIMVLSDSLSCMVLTFDSNLSLKMSYLWAYIDFRSYACYRDSGLD